MIVFPTAASAPPSDLKVTTTLTSFTATWGLVPCEHRNALITSYIGEIDGRYIGGVFSTGGFAFTYTRAAPRTNYTIKIRARAVHNGGEGQSILLEGPSASVVGTTAVPLGMSQLVLYMCSYFYYNGVLHV